MTICHLPLAEPCTRWLPGAGRTLLRFAIPFFYPVSGPFGLSLLSLFLEFCMLLPILLLSAAGF
ncbi:MAG: MFS transporter, partial [Pseudomonas protegens]